jgi:hypothetical protein
MNFAVLVTEYLTYEFEKGSLKYYASCETCDRGGLPLEHRLHPPHDFGSIAFTYTETGDTLLFGSIIWMGTGALALPDSFFPADQCEELETAARDPMSKEYYNLYPVLDRPEFEARADTAWAHVKRLDIVWDFASGDYRVGFYMYAPTVGRFDPAAARWIIFLYRGKSN